MAEDEVDGFAVEFGVVGLPAHDAAAGGDELINKDFGGQSGADMEKPKLEKQTDPRGPCDADAVPDSAGRALRVRRGGAFTSPGGHMRSAVRHSVPAEVPFFHTGFRIARFPPAGESAAHNEP